jgi:hypothetical protein
LEKIRLSRMNSLAGSDLTISAPITARAELPENTISEDIIGTTDAIDTNQQKAENMEPVLFDDRCEGYVFVVGDLSLRDIVKDVDDTNNHVYALLEYHVNQCLFRTETVVMDPSRASASVGWSGDVLSIPISPSFDEKSQNGELLKVFVYSECLAIQDKLQGVCEIFLPSLYVISNQPSSRLFAAQYCGDLFDSSNFVKRKRKGTISFNWSIRKGQPTSSNYTPRSLRDNSQSARGSISGRFQSASDNNSVQSEFVIPNLNFQEINGMSPSLVMAAANTLQAWENNQEPIEDYYEDAKVFVPKVLHKDSHKTKKLKKQKQQTTPVFSPKHAWNKVEMIGIADGQLTEDPGSATQPFPTMGAVAAEAPKLHRTFSATSTTNASLLTEPTRQSYSTAVRDHSTKQVSLVESHQLSQQHFKLEKYAKLKSRHKHRNETTPVHSAIINHDIQNIFDQAYYIALLKVAAGFQLRIKELMVLLDSLDVPVNTNLLRECDPASARSDSHSFGAYSAPIDVGRKDEDTDWLQQYVQLPINHSTSFAASIADIVCQYPQILSDRTPTLSTLILSENQCTLAIKQLIKLIRGDYFSIRNGIFLACSGHPSLANVADGINNRNNKLVRGSFLSTTSSFTNNSFAVNAGKQLKANHKVDVHSSVDSVRPRRFEFSTMFHILSLMRLGNDQAYDRWESIHPDGIYFLSMTRNSFSENGLVTASVLQARAQSFQMTLQIIDAAWDGGLRPQDAVDLESVEMENSAAVKRKPRKKMVSDFSQSGDVTYSEWLVLLATTSQIQSLSSFPTSTIKLDPTSMHLIRRVESEVLQLSDAQDLFPQFLAQNRAFGWNLSLATLTTFTHAIGGFFGFRVESISQISAPNTNIRSPTSMLTDQSPPRHGTEVTHPLQLPQEKSGMCWVMLDFPSQNVKQLTLQSLLPLFQPSTSISYSASISSIFPSILQVLLVSRSKSISSTNSWTVESVATSIDSLMVDFSAVEICVQMMQSCFTVTPHSNAPHKEKQAASTLLRRLSHISPHEIVLGMKLRVATLSLLRRLCERFEWFDRPSEISMAQFAGEVVEVISLADLNGKQRIGVRLVESLKRQQISNAVLCEALPLEALVLHVSDHHRKQRRSQTNESTPTIQEGVIIEEPTRDWIDKSTKSANGEVMGRVKSLLKKKLESAIDIKVKTAFAGKKKDRKSKKHRQQKLEEEELSSNSSVDEEVESDESSQSSPKTKPIENINKHKTKLTKIAPVNLSQRDLANLSLDDTNEKMKSEVATTENNSRRPKSAGGVAKDSLARVASIARPKSAVISKHVKTVHGRDNNAEVIEGNLQIETENEKDYSWLKAKASSPQQHLHQQLFAFQSVPGEHIDSRKPIISSLPLEVISDVFVAIPLKPEPPTKGQIKSTKKMSAKLQKEVLDRQREKEVQLREAEMGIAGSSYNAAIKGWNDPVLKFVAVDEGVPLIDNPGAANYHRRPPPAVIGADHKAQKNASLSPSRPLHSYVPYNDSLPAAKQVEDMMGLSLGVRKSSPSSPTKTTQHLSSNLQHSDEEPDEEVEEVQEVEEVEDVSPRIEVHIRSPKSPKTTGDRRYQAVTTKVNTIRNKPRTLEESTYYNRELARNERAANRADDVLRRNLKKQVV